MRFSAALLLVSSLNVTALGEETTPAGTTVADFLLTSAAGERVHLADPAIDCRATVVAFLALIISATAASPRGGPGPERLRWRR